MTLSIAHHAKGIQLVLEMMPKLGMTVPEGLTFTPEPGTDSLSGAFNLHQELTFYNDLVDLSQDPLIGLKLSKVFPSEAYGLFGLAILCSPNLRNAFEFIQKYGDLTYSLLKLTYDIKGDEATFKLSPTDLKLRRKIRAFFADRDTSAAVIVFNGVIRETIPLTRVGLVHDGHGLEKEYQDHFGCDIIFNAPFNSIAFSSSILDIPAPYRDDSAFAACAQNCEKQLSNIVHQDDLVSAVHQQFMQRPGYLHDIKSIATQFNMSARTLRRRLAEKDTSYKELQQDVLFQMSKDYLINSNLRLEKIAELVGYSDSGNFTHAFKRWAGGVPPSKFRRISRKKQGDSPVYY